MSEFLPGGSHGIARGPGDAKYPALWRGYLGGIVPWGIGRHSPNPGPSRYAAATIGTAWTLIGSPLGRAIQFTGNAALQWDGHASFGHPFKVGDGNGPITIQAHFRYVHKSSATKMYLFRSDNQTLGQLPHGYGLYVEAHQDQLVFTTDRGTGGDAQPAAEWKSPASSLTPQRWHHVVASIYAWDFQDLEISQFVVMWIDGRLVFPGVPATELAFAHRLADHARCGTASGATQPDFALDLLSVWNTRLGWREIDHINADPLAMFRRAAVARDTSRAARRISIGGVSLKRFNTVLAG